MPPSSRSPDARRAANSVAFAAVRTAAERHREALLNYPNVIDVRPGYKFTDGWITDTPAVVVTVLRKVALKDLAADDVLPQQVDNVAVDVAPATPVQQLRHLKASQPRGPEPKPRGRPQQPTAEDTRGTTAVPPGVPDLEPYLEPGTIPTEAPAGETAVRGTTSGRNYREPTDIKLSPVSGAMTLTCHASPDAGWPTLEAFLSKTKKSLTVAMYDFGAKHIFDAIEKAVRKAPGPFILNLDRRSNPKRKGELTEEEVQKKFKTALKDKFQYSTAAVGVLYPNAYHIKVAVRDGSSVWLSSGNWQGSNQPDADATTLSVAEQRKLLSERNREWHIVADNAKLAKLFEDFIQYDVSEAKRVAGTRGAAAVGPVDIPELVMPSPDIETRALKQVKIFPSKKFTFTAAKPVKVQPILTPDNYGEHIIKLIRSAKKSLYFQNQYIKIYQTFPDTGDKPGLKDLVDALLDRQTAGVDVRFILRNGDARTMLEALKTYGFDVSAVKLQGGCHNKGIVVDSKVVLVSSQNYSADGVRFNRDAGLIIYDPGVAKYFEAIFEYDWEHRAYQQDAGERGGMPLLPAVAAMAPVADTRSGRRAVKVSWNEFYEE